MPKKKSKNKLLGKLPDGYVEVSFSGIWDRSENKLVFVSMEQEMAETEFDLEGYDEDQFSIVNLIAMINVSSLG